MIRIRQMLAGVMLVLLSVLVLMNPGEAQWQVPNHAVPIGKGSGTGFDSAAPGTSGLPFTSRGAAVDPAFGGDVYFESGRPWVDVRAFGAVGDGVTNDKAAIQNAINAVQAFGTGGTVYFPPSNAGYCIKTAGGITISGVQSVRLIGASLGVSISSCGVDTTLFTLNSGGSSIEYLSLVGKGTNNDTGTFGASNDALVIGSNCTHCLLKQVFVVGGRHAIASTAGEFVMEEVNASTAYGSSVIYLRGGAWIIRSKFDQAWPQSAPAAPLTIATWAATTSYSLGAVVSTGGYFIQATTAGTSGGSAPTLKNYGIAITDGTVVWQLVAPSSYASLQIDTGAAEVQVVQSDFTGPFSPGILISNTLAGTAPNSFIITDSVIGHNYSAGILANAGNNLTVKGTRIGGCHQIGCSDVSFASAWNGDAIISNSTFLGGPIGISVSAGKNYTFTGNAFYGTTLNGVLIAANINAFTITDNCFCNSTAFGTNQNAITVAAGTSDYYTITGNNFNGVATTQVVDGGTGTNKFVSNQNTVTAGSWSSSGAFLGIDSNFTIADDADPSKLFKFQASGITTATTRTYTVPNANGTLPLLSLAQTWSAINSFSNATAATSASTGAVVISTGGLGVGGSVWANNLVSDAGITGVNYIISNVATFTNIAAPSSPAAAHVAVYSDLTDQRFHDKNSAGTIGTTIVADTGAANNFVTAISTAGVISKAQPSFSNLSGSATCAQLPALTGDVTHSAGSCATTLASIPSGVTMAGSLLATAIAAPGTPAVGKASLFVDSTTKTLKAINDAGTLSTTVIADTGASNNFLTAISPGGVISKAQPSFTNLSGSATCAQLPALTGDVTTSAGSCATTLAATQTAMHTWSANQTFTQSPLVQLANATILIRDSGTSFAFMDIRGGLSGVNGLRFGQEGSGGGNNLILNSNASDAVINMRDNARLLLGTNNTAVAYLGADGGATIGINANIGANNFQAAGHIKSPSATAGVGYATGAGGTVTQATSKATAVTLNKVTGAITMDGAALAAATIVSFVLTNSAVAATDVIFATHESGGTLGAYHINCRATGAGTAACDVRNNTAGSLSEAIVIRFAVMKSVNSWLLERDITPTNDNKPKWLNKVA